MPEPTIVSPDAEMVTAYGGAGATVTTGCAYFRHLSAEQCIVQTPVSKCRRGGGWRALVHEGRVSFSSPMGALGSRSCMRSTLQMHRRRYDDHKPRTPPPDLPSLLLDSRICYLGAL